MTVPARIILQKALEPNYYVAVFAPLGTILLLVLARVVFNKALSQYRSASS